MARATGYPIIPIGFAANRAWHLSSWDAFTIAKPFSRVAIVYGEPLRVGREGGEAALEAATETLRERLMAAEVRGCELIEATPDW